MSALDIVLLVIIACAVIGAVLYIIKKKKRGGCIGCSGCDGCSKSCQEHEKCCGSSENTNFDIHIKRSTI